MPRKSSKHQSNHRRMGAMCRHHETNKDGILVYTCNTYASFGYLHVGKKVSCLAHKEPGMVSFMKKRCKECNRIAQYNYPGEIIRVYCTDHKKNGMVTIEEDKCKYVHCNKVARYGWNNTSTNNTRLAIYCADHKLQTMVNLFTPLSSTLSSTLSTTLSPDNLHNDMIGYEHLSEKFDDDCLVKNIIEDLGVNLFDFISQNQLF